MAGESVVIVPLRGESAAGPVGWVTEAAGILLACFDTPDGYPTLEAATVEMDDLVANAACLLVAVEPGGRPDGQPAGGSERAGTVVGLVGALPRYRAHAWELHPLAVRPDRQGHGIGTALVAALEAEARRAGADVLFLGTDDTTARTSAGGVDLFPGVLAHAARIRSLQAGPGGHPFAFYQRLGFEVIGLLPDANGFGRPDILMAKRIKK